MRTGHGGWRQGLVALVLAIGALGRTAGAQSTSHRFTSSADFNSGTLDSVNHSDYPDQLQLNASSSSDPFAYIAQPIEGTVLKMDTTTGKQVARYPSVYLASCPTCPVANNSACDAWSGNWSPSRTAVDPNGNVWVANRGFGSCGLPRIANDGQGSITMIGSVTAGTCIDRNGNGAIDSSNDANGDGIIDRNDPNEYLGQNDECLIKSIAVGPRFAIIRAIALDTDGTIWVGGYTTQYAYHIDPATGQQLGQVKLGNWPYGFVIRGNFLYGTGIDAGWATSPRGPSSTSIPTLPTHRTPGILVGARWWRSSRTARVFSPCPPSSSRSRASRPPRSRARD